MRATLYINNTRVTKKYVSELVGVDRVERYIKEAKEDHMRDPYEQHSYWLGGNNMLTIELS